MTRQLTLVFVSLAALVGCLVATLVTVADRDRQLRGHVDATRTQELPYILPRLGVNAELTQYAPADLPAQLARMQDAGVTWVRQFFPWNEIEPGPGQFAWESWDALVGAFEKFPGLKPVAVLMNAPEHASGSPLPSAPPRDPAAFGQFARALAQRYGHVIDHYQVWDEPNLTDAWGRQDPEPVHYLAMLQAAWQAIHGADPGATVIAAALAPTVEQGPRNLNEPSYLGALYALGAADWMDAVAAKPYGFDSPPDDRRVAAGRLNFSRIIALRELMVQHGDGHKPLWASAWGWNSLPADWSAAPSIWGQVSTEERSAWTLAALARAEREWPWLGAMILQHWQPDVPPDDPLQGFALLDAANQATPLLTALEQRRAPAAAGNGLHPVESPWAQYSGTWTFGEAGADFGWTNDSQVRFDFVGEKIALLVREDDYVAWFYASVDGEPANALPHDTNGRAYLTLTSATRQPVQRLVTIADNLGPGVHRLELAAIDLVPDELQARWALAGFAVSQTDAAAPWERQILAGSIASLVAALALLVTASELRPGRVWQAIAPRLSFLGRALQPVPGALASLLLMLGMLLTWGDAIPVFFRRESLHPLPALLTAGLVLLQPGLLLTLLALLLLFVMFYHRPALGLMLTLLWAPFYLYPLQLFHYAFPLAEVLVLLTGLAWTTRQLVLWARRHRARREAPARTQLLRRLHALDVLLLAWLCFGLLAFSWSAQRGPAWTELRVLFLEPALFYLIFRHEARGPQVRLLLTDTLLTAGLLVALAGLWLFFSGAGVITAEGGARRLVSVYGSPNNAALFLGRCLPFALVWALQGAQRGRRRWGVVLCAVLTPALVLTQSAGALFLGLPLSLAATLLLMWRRRALRPLLGLGAAGILATWLATSSPRFARLLDFSSGTVFTRLRVWQSTLAMLRDDPLRGLGLDQFLYAYRDPWILPDAWREPNLSHPHNILLDFWVRLGLAGPLVLLALLAAFWRSALRAFRHTANHTTLVLLAGAMGSMVSLMAHGLVDNSVFVPDLAYVFVLLLGLVANAAGEDRPAPAAGCGKLPAAGNAAGV